MRELASSGLFLLLSFVAIGIVAAVALLSAQAQQQAFIKLAKRFRGKLEAASQFSLPILRLRHQGAQGVLRYTNHGTNHGKNQRYTHFQIHWPDDKLRLEIYPQNLLVGMRKLLGMTDIPIGSPQFDADFFIASNDRAAACGVLSSEVQQKIYALARLGYGGFWSRNNIYVEFAGGVLKVTKPTWLKSYSELESFVRLTLELFDLALLTRDSGIEFLQSAPAPDAAPPRCQVCGDALASDIVLCPRCQTPHHRECWQYFGGCSTYACDEKLLSARRNSRPPRLE